MPQAASQTPGIFICYRRDDTAGHAIHLFHYLRDHLRRGQIFMDIDIEPGEQFAEKIEREVGSCEIFIVLIGKQWLAVRGDAGRRLDDPEDFVRLEMVTALARGIIVIPVLVDGANIPPRKDLPENIAGLSAHQYCQLSNQDWNHDADRLVRLINRQLTERRQSRRTEKSEPGVQATAPAQGRGLAIAAVLTAFLALSGAALLPYLRKSDVIQPAAENAAGARGNTGVGGGGNTGIEGPAEQNSVVLKDKEFQNAFGMEFVWIPPGSFMMGSENGGANDGASHQAAIRGGFYMSKYEVTQAQWRALMEDNPSYFKGDNLPVEQVSWDDAQKFINRLNAQNDRYTYWLPSESEWEYAARAGTTDDYPSDLNVTAWHIDNSAQTNPVGQKQPNAFGLYDMQGNVWEWCQDLYQDKDKNESGGRRGLWNEGVEFRVIRGGGWYETTTYLRPNSRYKVDRRKSSRQLGFRVAAAPRP